jgi:hypothetical protein
MTALGVEDRFRSLLDLVRSALRPAGNAASFSTEHWAVQHGSERVTVSARIRITNDAGEREVMLYDVRPEATLLSDGPTEGLSVRTVVQSGDPDHPPRVDRYWTAFVVKPHDHSDLEVTVDVQGAATAELYALCLLVHVELYGGEGLRRRVHHVVLPLREREPSATLPWRELEDGIRVAPIRTHLLTPVDDPVAVAKRYAASHAAPGDILVVGESPLAVMQGRFRHPAEIEPSRAARRLCYLLSGVGSLGTGPGLQALIDQVGPARVLWAMARGLLGKAAGRDGDFYRALGPQARLIDDVTGTLPPYDRFVVLGPERADAVAGDIGAATGLEVAVVDANDLGFVDVIGATPGVDASLLARALRRNPAGNGEESTPLVLVRPPRH